MSHGKRAKLFMNLKYFFLDIFSFIPQSGNTAHCSVMGATGGYCSQFY